MRAILLFCGLPLVASATEEHLPPRSAGDDFATVYVKVREVEAPCWLTLESKDQTIQLPAVPSNELRQPGMRSTETWFHIQLRGCVPERGTQTSVTTGLKTWSHDSPVMSVTFNGAQDANTPSLFALAGITGAGLRLADEKGRQVVGGVASTPVIVTTVNNTLYWQASLERTAEKLTPGTFKAVLDFMVNYD